MAAGHNPGSSHDVNPVSEHAPGQITESAVREEVDRLLASPEFRASRRCQDFLRFIVDHTLAGKTDLLKERTIGMEVFGKRTSYDPSDDATVRVKAGDIRKRLEHYYQNNASPARISIRLPLGTYVPEFYKTGEVSTTDRYKSRRIWKAGLAATVMATACLLVFVLLRNHFSTRISAYDQFWLPMFQDQKPVSLCVAVVPVYSLREDPVPNQPIPAKDVIEMPNQFVAVGDLNAAFELSGMLSKMKRPYRLKIGNDLSFRDLRNTPAILVGYSYTQWSEISRGFRFSIDLDKRPFGVLDNGTMSNWTIPTHPDDPALTEDYAIVSRVIDVDTHSPLLEIVGISHYGTEAAADLVANPNLLEDALRSAVAGWQQRNLQIVLHIKIISGNPSAPSVVATQVW